MASTPHILWADDEIELLRAHIIFLEQRGYRVTSVANGTDALTHILHETIDLVLLDEQMPGMGGLETLAAIREVQSDVPVVMVTKSEEEHQMEEALGGQINDYLTKPVNPSQILLTCKRLLEHGRLRNERISQDYMRRFNQITLALMNPLSHEEWVVLYRELVRYDVLLEYDQAAREVLADQYREANRVFGRYIEEAYQGWIRQLDKHSSRERPVLSPEVIPKWVLPELRKERPVVFMVIDCMRHDQWLELEKLLNPWFSMKKDFYYSILPTATPYSRNAIFSGLLPRDIARRYSCNWSAGQDDEHSRNRHEEDYLAALLRRKGTSNVRTRYHKLVSKADGQALARAAADCLQADLSAIVVNFVDILAHSRSDSDVLKELAPDERAYRAVTRTWLEHSWLLQAFQILAKHDCTIVMTSDHGAVRSLHPTTVRGDRSTSTALRFKCGRRLKANKRHAICISDPPAYGLPADNLTTDYLIAKEDYYFVYPTNYHRYANLYRDSIQHGGAAMEEMILPVIRMRPRGYTHSVG